MLFWFIIFSLVKWLKSNLLCNDIPKKCLATIFDYENKGEEEINAFCDKIEAKLAGFQDEKEKDHLPRLITQIIISKFLYRTYRGYEKAFLNEFSSILLTVILEMEQRKNL
jgi:hypothetical protein